MSRYKTIRKSFEINGELRETVDLNAELFSYDEQVSQFIFQLTSKEKKIDLEGAVVHVSLHYTGEDGEKGVIEDFGGIHSIERNEVSYTVTERLRGHEGIVTMGLCVALASGEKLDIQNILFKMTRSLIDSGAGVAGEIYFESFEKIVCSLTEKVDQKIAEYNAMFSQVLEKYDYYDNKTELYILKMGSIVQVDLWISRGTVTGGEQLLPDKTELKELVGKLFYYDDFKKIMIGNPSDMKTAPIEIAIRFGRDGVFVQSPTDITIPRGTYGRLQFIKILDR